VMLMGGLECGFTIADATVCLTPDGLKTPLSLRYFYHRLRASAVLNSRLHFLMVPFRIVEKVLSLATSFLAKLRQ